ncbi:MAG: hybrid sensor histidine kinase/response regulator [Leptospiraceae bacterium]|nr:hybrid sensor histidine kinase/response regulator [Leptospiraceae bacterium]
MSFHEFDSILKEELVTNKKIIEKPFILIIEDDAYLREALQFYFQSKYNIIVCGDGQSGIDSATPETHVVLLDIRMQGKNGFETFFELKSKFPQLPIIFHSAYQDLKDPFEIINEYRPFAYITKGEGFNKLAIVVESAVEYYSQIYQNKLLLEELKALNETLEAKVSDRTIKLESAKAEIENLLKQELKAKETALELAESRKRLSIVGQTAMGIVHDLKNPISTIKAYAELANDDQISRIKRQEYLELISREIERLNNLAYEILDFSKSKIKLDLSEVSIKELLNEFSNFVKIDFEYSNISLSFHAENNLVAVLDKERIRRVLINLANNAREAMQEAKNNYFFSIKAYKENDYLVFALEDNGVGLPYTIEEKIFEAFATEGKSQGTGLGLYICKMIVEAHNGELTYITERGKGTTFFVRIPIQT